MIWAMLIGFGRRALGGIWGYAALAAAALATVATIYGKGRADAKRKNETRKLKDYKSTRERIDNAKGSSGDGADDIEWLRDYGDK